MHCCSVCCVLHLGFCVGKFPDTHHPVAATAAARLARAAAACRTMSMQGETWAVNTAIAAQECAPLAHRHMPHHVYVQAPPTKLGKGMAKASRRTCSFNSGHPAVVQGHNNSPAVTSSLSQGSTASALSLSLCAGQLCKQTAPSLHPSSHHMPLDTLQGLPLPPDCQLP